MQVHELADWLQAHDLHDARAAQCLRPLQRALRIDQVMVAFVAEFSRGKSELINALFFADFGRRIMPASAGRTTMCPTEMAWDAAIEPCLRLLPMQTRLQPQSLAEWRMKPEAWQHIALDLQDPEQMAAAMAAVAQTQRVSPQQAIELGFANPEQASAPDAQGQIEVPRWRHALINLAHPLLKQGLVILDTPGLNAVGAEPELTLSLLPQADAIVFVLAADAGVSATDLAIWRNHLHPETQAADHRLVVLNKIDTAWDGLDSAQEVQTQVERQRADTAALLDLPAEQVLPVSARKGLLAKLNADAPLLARSGLPALEAALAERLLRPRQAQIGQQVRSGLDDLQAHLRATLRERRRDLADQMSDLQGLQGKNTPVIKRMRSRIAAEQSEFDASTAKVLAVRAVHLRLFKEIVHALGTEPLRAHMRELNELLGREGIKWGAQRCYAQTFAQLRSHLSQAQSHAQEMQTMLERMFTQLNTEFGLALQAPGELALQAFSQELDAIEQAHVHYLAWSQSLRLAQPGFAAQLVRALAGRLRALHEAALARVEAWSKAALAQIDTQMRERRKAFERRLEAVDRIALATTGLDDRIRLLMDQAAQLQQSERDLALLLGACVQTLQQVLGPAPPESQGPAEQTVEQTVDWPAPASHEDSGFADTSPDTVLLGDER